MFEDDRSYYQHRAEVEFQRAQTGTMPCVVQGHYRLAQAYLAKLASDKCLEVEAS